MVAGPRFDLNRAREEARAKKQAEKIKKIVSSCVLFLVLIVLGVGGWVGWTKWQEARERAKAEAEAEQIAAERAAAERKRVENARREAERAKREAARKAEEARREAERVAREEARIADQKAREEKRRQAEEAKRQEAEEKVRLQELKDFAVRALSGTRFSIDEHVAFQDGTEDCFDVTVDEQRWEDLSDAARTRQAIDFFELLREKSDTVYFSESSYPDRETIARLLAKLDDERYTMVIRLTDRVQGRRFVIAGLDAERGLAVPEGCRELKQGGRFAGWTVPFRYGDTTPFFVMESRLADPISREWASLTRKIRKDAAKLTNREEYIAERLAKELPDFVRSVKIELQTPPPEEKKPDPQQRREIKPKATMRGGSDIRRMNGPQLLR